MDNPQLMGYAVYIVITLGAFITVVAKFVQPLNDLRIEIQKLNDNFSNIRLTSDKQDQRITEHGKEIDKLDTRVGKLETRVDMYHKE